MLSFHQVNTYIQLGFLPRFDCTPFPSEWLNVEIMPDSAAERELTYLVDQVVVLIRMAILQSAEEQNIIPLSGGLDSRLVMSVLAREGLQVQSVSVGTPGTLDFDVPPLVAKKLGVEHRSIDLSLLKFDTMELVEYARRINDFTSILFTSFHMMISDGYPGQRVQTGLLGDFLGGSSVDGLYETKTWDEEKKRFAKNRKRRFLLAPGFDVGSILSDVEKCHSALTNREEIVYRVRHTCTFRPHLFKDPSPYKRPFANEELIGFLFSVPRSLRFRSKLYQMAMMRLDEEAFNLPSTSALRGLSKKKMSGFVGSVIVRKYIHRAFSSRGLSWPVFPFNNYFNFNILMKKNKSFSDVVEQNMSDLQKRGVVDWISPEKILRDAKNGKYAHINSAGAHPLLKLLDLELLLKANVRPVGATPSSGEA